MPTPPMPTPPMPTPPMPTVAETIAQSLHDAGVRFAFGMPGGEVVSVLEALQRVGIRFELMHHEESAVFAADAYARATGKPGCALTTLGPGALKRGARHWACMVGPGAGCADHGAKAGLAAAGLYAPGRRPAVPFRAHHQADAQGYA